MELLEKKKRTLTGFSELLGMFREMESIQVEMKEMEVWRCTHNKHYIFFINWLIILL